jgi:hypothetical protein
MTNNEQNPEFEQEQQNEEEQFVQQEEQDNEQEEQVDWKKEALKYKNINERLQKKINQEPPIKNQPSDTSEIDKKLERLELLQKGYSDEAVKFLMEHGGTKALENKYVSKAVQELEEERKQQQAIEIEGDSTSGTHRKYTVDEMRKMTASELETILKK